MGLILLITCQQQGIIQVSKGLVLILLDFVLLNLSYSRSKQSYVERQESLQVASKVRIPMAPKQRNERMENKSNSQKEFITYSVSFTT